MLDGCRVAVIGGSGVHDSPGFKDLKWRKIDTRYRKGGDVSLTDRVVARMGGLRRGVVEYQLRDDGVIFIPRHGHERRYGPCVTQYGANLIAASMLGANVVVATSAVGSLDENIPVKSLIIPDDYDDQTNRNDNLYGEGIVLHSDSKQAFSEPLRRVLLDELAYYSDRFVHVHETGTYVCIPGDRFGTRAEGQRRRLEGANVVGMTACPEASMAVQLGLHYAILAFAVDNDLDANHEQGTLAIMRELSKSDKVPYVVGRIVEQAKSFAQDAPPLPQLVGNIIPGDTTRIRHTYLRQVAREQIARYCKKEAA